ncbi:MAG: hypothetical protein CJBNEKGG_03996 [Prosthecobacter sp.]|nr:hypothetical protein [Prosthecobacter sp.]
MSTSCRLLLGALLTVLISSCVSPRERRIANNPQIYQSLSTSDQLLVQQGRIREGMTKEGVFLSYGRPDSVAVGKQKGVSLEKWTYMGSQPVYANTFGMSMGWGGYRGYRGYRGLGYGYCGPWDPYWGNMGTTVMYVPYKAATVTFRGNRVTEYLTGPQ